MQTASPGEACMTNFSGEAEDAIGDSVAYLSRSHRGCLERECARDAMQDLIGRPRQHRLFVAEPPERKRSLSLNTTSVLFVALTFFIILRTCTFTVLSRRLSS